MDEQNALIVGRGALVDAEKIFTLAQVALIITRVRSFDDDAIAFGHLLHRFGKAQVIVLHEKLKHAASGVAAEAMIDPLLFVDRERRRLLTVKRTKSHVIAAGFLERDVVGDHFDNRCAIANFGDFILTNHG